MSIELLNPLPSNWTCVSRLSHSYPVVPATPGRAGVASPSPRIFSTMI